LVYSKRNPALPANFCIKDDLNFYFRIFVQMTKKRNTKFFE